MVLLGPMAHVLELSALDIHELSFENPVKKTGPLKEPTLSSELCTSWGWMDMLRHVYTAAKAGC